MKQWLLFALTLTFLIVFTSPGAAQPKGGEKEKPGALGGGASSMPAPGGSKTMTGKVLQLNETAKTFTVMANGKAVMFTAADLKALPKVGDIVDIIYTGTPGGSAPLRATTVNASKSNNY